MRGGSRSRSDELIISPLSELYSFPQESFSLTELDIRGIQDKALFPVFPGDPK